MLSNETILTVLTSLPVYQVIFFSILLFSWNRKSNPSGFYLGLLCMNLGIFLAFNYLFFLGHIAIFTWCYYFYLPVFLLIVPCFYLFLSILDRQAFSPDKRKLILLFSPSALLLILNVFILSKVPQNVLQVFIVQGFTYSQTNIAPGIKTLHYIHILGIVIFPLMQSVLLSEKIFQIFNTYRKSEISDFKPLPGVNLKFISFIYTGVMIFVLAVVISGFTIRYATFRIVLLFNFILLLSSAMIGFFGLKQDTRFKQFIKNGSKPETIRKNNLKRAVGTNSTSEHSKAIDNLKSLLATQKLYLDKDLTIYDLAREMKTSFRDLSFLLNKVMKTNFYGLVNEFRVNEAREMLSRQEYDHYTLEAISDKVGFHSRSSFYSCFKKLTGQTPAEFRSSHRRRS